MYKASAAVAAQMLELPDADGFPTIVAWERSPRLSFNTDWQGKSADPERETEVQLLWTPEWLFLRFRARFRVITVFPDAEPNGRREQLWDRDVAEVFLQPDPSQPRRYKEFEVSPNGFWIDLGRSRENVGGGNGAPHEMLSREFRSRGYVESEFLPRGRRWRTAVLFRLAAYTNSSARFPPSGSIWGIGLRARADTAKVAEISKLAKTVRDWRPS